MSTINPIMHPEEKAWNDLRTAASSRLRPGFAGRVLGAARGPGSGAWAALREAAAACLRPGFASRVVRAAQTLGFQTVVCDPPRARRGEPGTEAFVALADLLVRAAGPTLAAFGLTSAMPDPRLEVYRGATRTAANNAASVSGSNAGAAAQS